MFFRNHIRNKKSFFNRPVWQNSVKNIICHPLRYYQPESIENLKDIVNEAIGNKITVRAVGAGHSYSSAPHTQGLLADMTLLDKNLGKYKYTTQPGHYYEFEGGITIRNMNSLLDKLGLAIATMGGIDHQTLAGALLTGTHGSNLGTGALSALIRSIVLVTNHLDGEGAKVYRIEKKNGLTDPALYPPEQHELIQDDDVFNSVLVSFGAMGIIYSLVIEVEELFYLSECKKVDTWDNVKQMLKNGLLAEHRSVYCQVNPYMVNGERLALVAWQDVTGPKGIQEIIREDLKHKLWHRLDRAIRNPVSLLGNFPPTYWIFVWLINKYPSKVPRIINQAIKNQRDKTYVNKSYKVMYQGLDYLKERAYDSEFAIEIENDKYLETVEALIQLLQHLHETYSFQISSPMGIRFVRRSDAYLTPEHGKDVCYIDTPVLKHAYGNEILLYQVQKVFMEQGANPHWGKMNEYVDKAYIRTGYVKFEAWEKQFRRFNSNGIFSNRFTRQFVE